MQIGLPPTDLLKQAEGIESQLNQGRRLGLFGWLVASLVTALEVAYLASTSLDFDEVVSQWPFLVGIAVIVLSLLLVARTKLWIRESEEPFRYTYSVDPLDPVGDATEPLIDWVPHDLSKKLSERITRLSVLEQEQAKEAEGEDGTQAAPRERDSHIQISGHYGKRWDSDQGWVIEIVPRVAIGQRGVPATLGRAVTFGLDRSARGKAVYERAYRTARSTAAGRPPRLDADDYLTVFERVYFSVATKIYEQIREDVENKIRLLPTNHLRGTAYLREAEDYARSNTLDAYTSARDLFGSAMRHFDRRLRPLPSSRLRRLAALALQRKTTAARRLRGLASRAWPRFVRREVLTAEAEVGYAKTLLSHQSLARLSGVRTKPPFEAPRVSSTAINRLEGLDLDSDERTDALFKAYVTQAWADYTLGYVAAADGWMRSALSLKPAEAEDDSAYLLVAGYMTPRILSRLRFLRRAVETDPESEIARSLLGESLEMLWRRHREFEVSVAGTICDEHRAVVALNPGNVATWGRLGFIQWLLAGAAKGDLDTEYLEKAERAFQAGREYKDVRGETVVAELDYGLTRLAAEQGLFEEAYKSYVNCVAAQLAERDIEDAEYFWLGYGRAIPDRFRLYEERVKRHYNESLDADGKAPRQVQSVYAFVLYDYGEACRHYYYRSGDEGELKNAQDAYEAAISENENFVLPRYQLARLHRFLHQLEGPPDNGGLRHLREFEGQLQEVRRDEPQVSAAKLAPAETEIEIAERQLQEVLRDEPEWPAAKLALAETKIEIARSLTQEIERLEAEPSGPGAVLASQGSELFPQRGNGSRAKQTNGRPPAHEEAAPELDRELEDRQHELTSLKKRRTASLESAAHHIGGVLPHACFVREGEAEKRVRYPSRARRRLGGEGQRLSARVAVESLITGTGTGTTIEPVIECGADWNREFDGVHVEALIRWAQLLEVAAAAYLSEAGASSDAVRARSWRAEAISSLEASNALCEHIREHYYPADLDVLVTQRDACLRLLDRTGEADGLDPDRLSGVINERKDDIRYLVTRELVLHPAHFLVLGWTLNVLEDDRKQLLEALLNAVEVEGAASPTLVWVGERLRELDQLDAAESAFEAAALRSFDRRAAPEAGLRLGDLRMARGDTAGAKPFYRIALESGDPGSAPRAAVQLAELSRDGENGVTGLYRRVIELGAYPAFSLGEQLRERGDARWAKKAYRKAVSADDPDWSPRAALSLGGLLVAEGHEREAEQAYRRAVRGGEPKVVAEANLQLGNLLRERGERSRAMTAYEHAVASEDGETAPRAALALGDLLLTGGERSGAERAYEQAVKSEHIEVAASAAAQLGQLLQERGDVTGAHRVFDTVSGSGAQAAITLGDTLRASGDPAGAGWVYERGAALPNDVYTPDAALRLGDLRAEEEDLGGAEEAYGEAIESGDIGVAPQAGFRLGELLKGQERSDAAQRCYAKVAALGATAAVGLGDMLKASGYLDEAKRAYERGARSPNDLFAPDAALRLGELLAEQKDSAGAERAYVQAIDSKDVTIVAMAQLRLGDLLVARGDQLGARRAYVDAVQTGDETAAPRAAVRLDRLVGGKQAAGEFYPRVIESGPRAALQLGEVLSAERRDPRWAERAYREAIDSEDRGAASEAALGLGDLRAKEGDHGGARQAYGRAIELGQPPVAAAATLRLGDLLTERGDANGAESAYRQAIDSDQAGIAPRGALRLGLLKAAYGNEAGAREAFEMLVGSSPFLAKWVGDFLAQQGYAAGAEHAYRVAIDSGDTSVVPAAQLKLGDLSTAGGADQAAETAYGAVVQSPDASFGDAASAAVKLAELLAARGDEQGARQGYEQVVGRGAQGAIALGGLLSARGDLASAERAYQAGAEATDDAYAPDAALRLGELLAKQGDSAGAEHAYRQAIGSDDVTVVPAAKLGLGDLLASRDDFEAARSAYTDALESADPDVAATAAFRLAKSLEAIGDHAGAKEALERAIAAGSRSALGLGDVLKQSGDLSGAERAYRRGAGLSGDLYAPDAALRLGELLAERGEREGAESAYWQAIASEDTTVTPTATLRLGESVEGRGDQGAARRAYLDTIDLTDADVALQAALKLVGLLKPST